MSRSGMRSLVLVGLLACGPGVARVGPTDPPEPVPPQAAGECTFRDEVRCIPASGACAVAIRRAHADPAIADPDAHYSAAQTHRHAGQCCYIEYTTDACD